MNEKANNRDGLSLFWFRRDLRMYDNTALYHALRSGNKVLPLFIFDENILGKLSDNTDSRVNFIYKRLEILKQSLRKTGSDLMIIHSTPTQAFRDITEKYNIREVYINEDYEPYALGRDKEIELFLRSKEIKLKKYKDQVIFSPEQILKKDGNPYTVFTPYSKRWKEMLGLAYPSANDTSLLSEMFYSDEVFDLLPIESLGFRRVSHEFPSEKIDFTSIDNYARDRNIPSLDVGSRQGVHLRFGTVSIRELVSVALQRSETWLNELIWREFFMQILYHFPHVVDKSFKPAYDNIEWLNDTEDFEKWCQGRTGYKIVDAGMNELNETGYMHNRVRMVTASFLCKHLLVDWRLGEAYFAEKLLDYELSSNNGNWQWAAGSGCDAAPWFRIFNPYLQEKKFDPAQVYINRWLSNQLKKNYPEPLIEHGIARERCLQVYKYALRR